MKRIKLPSLSRGGKIIKNLLLSAVCIVLAWGFAYFQIDDPYLSFRRAERANWVGPAQIQASFKTKYRDVWTVGTYQDQVLFHANDFEYFDYWQRRSEGTEVIPVPDSRLHAGEAWVVALDVPEGTAAAVLSTNITCHYWQRMNGLTMSAVPLKSCPDYFDHTYVAEGELLEDGAVLFHVTQGATEDTMAYVLENALISRAYEWLTYRQEKEVRAINCAMEAVFYGEAGEELGRAELSTLA